MGAVIPIVALGVPFALVIFAGPPLWALAHEFIAYRIGDALALMGGEGGYVRPVQGLPNALLSKVIVWALGLGGWAPNSYDALQTYAAIFLIVVVAAFSAVLIAAFRSDIEPRHKLAVSAYVLFPLWIGGVPYGLYIAPDYWIFEHLWLSASLLVLFVGAPRSFWLGVWCGLGASIKIPLAGIGLVLLVVCRASFWRFLLGGAAAYIAINIAYGGFWAPFMLWRQATFFLHPNVSAQYADGWAAFLANPAVLIFLAAACLALSRRWVLAVPVALYVYLVFGRPHGSSLASAALGLVFLAVAFGRLRYTLPALLVAGIITGFEPVRQWSRLERQIDTLEAERLSAHRGAWMANVNRWNARLLPQLMGFNGQLALRASHDEPRAFETLFPESAMFDLSQINDAMATGRPILWTAPVGAPDPLEPQLVEAGYHIEAQPFSFLGRDWIFHSATR